MSNKRKSNVNIANESPRKVDAMSVDKKRAASVTDWKTIGLGALAIIVAAFLVYQPLRHGQFIWDDDIMLTNNALVKSPGEFKNIWFSTIPHDYFPLTLTLLWVEWRIWGMNPAGYLMVNVLLHALGSVVIWQVLKRLRVPAAWLIALLFTLHPVASASVGWVAECKNTLSLVFYSLTFLTYLQFENSGRRKWYVFSLIAFLLALLSKTSVVMLPFLLLGCAWWQRRRITIPDILRSAPFFALSLVFGLITVWFQLHRAVGDIASEVPNDSLLVRLLGGSWGLWFYLWKVVFPVHLSVIYPRWEINASSPMAYGPGVLWLGMLIGTWIGREKIGRAWFFALFYFTLTLLPVLGFVRMSYLMHSQVADHWQYLALIGPLALFVGGGAYLLRKFKVNSLVMGGTGFLVAVVCFALTFRLANIHAAPQLLWEETLQQNPNAWAAHNNLGRLYALSENIEEAGKHFSEGARLKPDSAQTRYNYGRFLLERGKIKEAIENLSESVRLGPGQGAARFDLGDALDQAGKPDEAIRQFEALLELDPGSWQAHNYIGTIEGKRGRFDEALKHYLIVVKIRPGSFDGQFNIGLAYFKKGQLADARKYFTEALRLIPDSALAHQKLGETLEKEGNREEAIPHLATAQYLRAVDAMRKGNGEEARQSFEKALRFDPLFVDAHYQLGLVLLAQGKTEEAQKEFAETIRLDPNHAGAREKLSP